MLPLLLFEDDHLLVINKPAGMNTHAPSPFAGEGIYEWLKHRESRWAHLGLQHRLDKETSGVLVFGKTALANRSLTEQFTQRVVRKTYALLTDRPVARECVVKSNITRAGDRYVSATIGDAAETRFRPAPPAADSILFSVEAEPVTGRTHQIRVHAAEKGFPILGDSLYGGSPFSRVCLHAAELKLCHPLDGRELLFSAAADFDTDPRAALRRAVINSDETNAFRCIHGAGDGWPGWYVDQLGAFVLSQAPFGLDPQRQELLPLVGFQPAAVAERGIYHKVLDRQVRRSRISDASPRWVQGSLAPERFVIRENGVQFEMSFAEGYSTGLFLDQRDNRRRLLNGHVAAGFELSPPSRSADPLKVLNAFAYTCGFSVCAAKTGARTTSLDLSRKYLEWGKRNFLLNDLDPAEHNFIYGDAFEWFRRLAKKGRGFDVIILDPPTFSQSKESGIFRAEKDFGKLVSAALPLLQSGGVLLASTNAAEWAPEEFLEQVADAIAKAGRRVLQQHYVPQPPDFPISKSEPAYLKTAWLRVG